MKDVSALAGALHSTSDPEASSARLLECLVDEAAPHGDLDSELVAVLRSRFRGSKHEELSALCRAAAAWVLGTRYEARSHSRWAFVASHPGTRISPPSVQRLTGETLRGLVLSSVSECRIVVPFIDPRGWDVLSSTIDDAVARGVNVVIASREEGLAVVRARSRGVELHRIDASSGWPHLKVVTADTVRAYVGSANLTYAALSGANLELGLLVEGSAVRDVVEILNWVVYAEEGRLEGG